MLILWYIITDIKTVPNKGTQSSRCFWTRSCYRVWLFEMFFFSFFSHNLEGLRMYEYGTPWTCRLLSKKFVHERLQIMWGESMPMSGVSAGCCVLWSYSEVQLCLDQKLIEFLLYSLNWLWAEELWIFEIFGSTQTEIFALKKFGKPNAKVSLSLRPNYRMLISLFTLVLHWFKSVFSCYRLNSLMTLSQYSYFACNQLSCREPAWFVTWEWTQNDFTALNRL